jgi:transketolase N-terminal domain/subunit
MPRLPKYCHDPKDPNGLASDVSETSKGHTAPILYAAWAEAGAFPREHCEESIPIWKATPLRACHSYPAAIDVRS